MASRAETLWRNARILAHAGVEHLVDDPALLVVHISRRTPLQIRSRADAVLRRLGHATTALAAEELPQDVAGLADVLSSRTDTTVADVIVPGVWPGLEVLPTIGGGSLGLVRDELIQTAIGREGRLRDALAVAGEAWDLVLIDCAPSLDQLTINALAAADIAAAVTEAAQNYP